MANGGKSLKDIFQEGRDIQEEKRRQRYDDISNLLGQVKDYMIGDPNATSKMSNTVDNRYNSSEQKEVTEEGVTIPYRKPSNFIDDTVERDIKPQTSEKILKETQDIVESPNAPKKKEKKLEDVSPEVKKVIKEDDKVDEELESAKSRDRWLGLMNDLDKAFARMGAANPYTMVKPVESGVKLPTDAEDKLRKQRLLEEQQKREKEKQEFDKRYKKAVLDLKNAKQKSKGLNLTPGLKELDKEFAKEVIQWDLRGGYSDVEKQLKQLKEAKEKLKEMDTATGPVVGTLPRGMRARLFPDSVAIQDQVEEVVQRNLRTILGAQFTEKEGTRLIQRAYNPALSEKENTKRLGRLIDQIEEMAKSKNKAVEYFTKKGTLKGYEGRSSFSADDLLSEYKEDENRRYQEGLQNNPAPNGEFSERNGRIYRWNPRAGKYQIATDEMIQLAKKEGKL